MAKKVIVVGGGPGGYVAAIRAAQLGAEVHVVENMHVGGTCLNIGCIPTKALLHTAQNYLAALDTGCGIRAENVRVDWAAMMTHKDEVVKRLVGGVTGLFRSNKVTLHNGTAVMTGSHSVLVNGKEALTGDIIILATGSVSTAIKFPGSDLPGVIDSTAALSMKSQPKSMVLLGGGVIGVELACLYATLGTKVTIVEMLPEILPPIDTDISKILHKELENWGVTVLCGTKLQGAEKGPEGLSVKIAAADGRESAVPCENLLVAVGRRPNIASLGAENVGIKTERGAIVTDEYFQTNLPGVYAVGDCNAKLMLAHAASAQGIAAVEHALGHESCYNSAVVPSCVYSFPEISAVGLTEEQVKVTGRSYSVGLFPLSGNGKSLIEGNQSGIIKLISADDTHEVLGAHMIGPRVTDMIAELALAMNAELTVEDIVNTIHAHPTVSESVGEAALAVFGNAIHSVPKKLGIL